jgi:hypothetical protein
MAWIWDAPRERDLPIPWNIHKFDAGMTTILFPQINIERKEAFSTKKV